MEQIQQIQSIVTSMKFIDVTTVQKELWKSIDREILKKQKEKET